MTLVEHLKSDSDVIKLIVLSIGVVGLCAYFVYLVKKRFLLWPKKVQTKRRQLQRPFIASSISPTPKDGSPTVRVSPFNNESPNRRLSPSSKQAVKTAITQNSPSTAKQPNPRYLNQIFSLLAKTDLKQSAVKPELPKKNSTLLNFKNSKDFKPPLVLDTSTTTDDSTLPSLVLSSEGSTESITETLSECKSSARNMATMEKVVTSNKDTNIENNNEIIPDKNVKTFKQTKLPARLRRDEFTTHLWSHKCRLPCLYEVKPPLSPSSSSSSHSDTHDNDYSQDLAGYRKHYEMLKSKDNSNSNTSNYFEKKTPESSNKCASDVCVQTDYSGDIKSFPSDQGDFKISPLCSSDSTIKETDHTLKCCCYGNNHKNRKHNKPQKKLKKSALVRSLDRKLPEELEMFDNEASIMDRTSFIPPKSWYSLGSLCDGEDNCEVCTQSWKNDAHRRYHMRMYDSDTKLNSSGDAISYNDTGYTSTEEGSRNSTDMKESSSLCDQQSSPENGSYDGDYESDDEIFKVRLVGSEDMVYKPLPSISEPFGIEAYAAKEWSSNTSTAKAIRQGYAAIPDHVSCHQLRQIRGDNYCAIRATLFQALLNRVPLLDRLPREGIPQILRTILSATKTTLQEWSFAARISVEKSEVISTIEEMLTFYMDEVQVCLEISSMEARTEHLLSLFNEEAANSEFKLLEAVKLIMLYHSVLLHKDINEERDVPVLAWLLFARDTSQDPCGLLRNHLNSVGDTGGLEQVEMCLLGYSLGVVIQVFRPSQVTKSDFIANYPYLEDMPAYSPTVYLVAEDDRHYNIVVN